MGQSNYIRFDWAMKRLLRQKANFSVLEGFLSSLLDKPVKIEQILSEEGNKADVGDKFNRVDLLAKDDRGELFIIEVQTSWELDYFQRMLYGASKAITEYITEGEPYEHVRKLYSVHILFFNLGEGKDYVYRGRTEFRGIHKNDVLQLTGRQRQQFSCKDIGDLYPEYYVLRVAGYDAVATTPLDEWISFLKTGDIPDNARAPGLPEARERLRRDRLDRQERAEYDARMENLRFERSVIKTSLIEGEYIGWQKGREDGLAEGETIGLEKGKAEALTAMAVNAYRNGLSIEQIMAFSGLAREEVIQILKANGIAPEG
ncbi:MAG: Rpn family recombination-promoting nuclease/putative transposase [Bacteroidales bacterium]